MSRTHLARRASRIAAGLLTLVLGSAFLAACGSSATPSTAGAPDGSATCTNAAALKAAVATLDAVDLTTVTDVDLKAAIDAVGVATDALIKGASPKITQQVADLEGAVNVLEAAYEEGKDSIAASAPAIKDAIADVDTSAAAIEVTLKPDCA